MATVDTTIIPDAVIKPLTGPSDITRQYSSVPRAEVYYWEQTVAIAPTGAADNQRFNALINLDPAFSYVLTGLSLHMMTTGTYNFPASTFAWLTDGVTGSGRTWRQDIRLDSGELVYVSGNESRVYECQELPNQVVIPQSGSAPKLQLELYNPTANDGAYECFQFYARFLQFDVLQATMAPMYHAQPTRHT